MNGSLSEDYWQGGDIIAASSVGLLAFPGAATYLLVVFVILRNPRTFANKSFYTLLLSLAISEITQVIVFPFYFIPCILLQRRVFGDDFDFIYGAVTCMCYYASIANMALIAINRYYAICQGEKYEVIFRERRTRLYILLAWLFGVFSGFWQLLPAFGYRLYVNFYTWGYDDDWGNTFFAYYDGLVWISIFSILFVCYVAILRRRPTRIIDGLTIDRIDKIRRERAERNLALHFGIILLVFLTYQLSVAAFSYLITVVNPLYYLAMTLFYIACMSCNPYIYLTFNSDIRSHCLRIFCRGRSISAVTSVSEASHRESNVQIIFTTSQHNRMVASQV